jgi:hypothetical protein
MACHIDGMKRANNNIRDWLDEGGDRLPKGEYGVDSWIHNVDTVARVRELHPPSSVMRVKIENDRRVFQNAMAQIQQKMILGVDKNVYVEPAMVAYRWLIAPVKRPFIDRQSDHNGW